MSHPTHAALSQLSIDDSVNVRKANRGAEPIFTGTIRKRGIIQRLLVRPHNGGSFTITDGGKRFDALIWLRDHGDTANGVPITADYQVPIEVLDETDEVARETSIITNIARAETHPVDRFERFAQLVEDGATPEGIAETYGMPRREVDKALALGDLHPKIRDAWRAGEIRAESVQAFTLTKDQKTQIKVFEKLSKSKQLSSRWTIRAELKAEDQEIGHLLTFIGGDTYEARGGVITALDLFEGKHVVSNTELVDVMAKEKLAAECARLVEAGWGWAAIDADMPQSWNWNWGKINPKIELTPDEEAQIAKLKLIVEDDEADWNDQEPAEREIDKIEDAARARAFGPKQMAKSGCVVDISDEGELEIKYGIIKPENVKGGAGVVESEQFEERRKAKTKEKKTTGGPATVTNALIHRLSTQMTKAAAAAVKKHPDDALDITIAAILANGDDFRPGVKLSHSGMGSHKAKGSFKSHYEAVSKLSVAKKLGVLAEAIGVAFDFQCHSADAFRAFRAVGLPDTLGKEMVAELREAFDAEDYFKSVPKALCLAAIKEAINEDEARKVASKPSADIKKFATTNVPKTGWLPPELRTAHYDGPAPKKPARGKK
jgi:ParB family transcriptional regulator, chromosome partitioning protein